MLYAECRGKLGSEAARAHDRAEDLLTSTVFQLLRYLPPAEWLPAVFGRVRPVTLAEDGVNIRPDPHWVPIDGVNRCGYRFWPRWGEAGEPDLLLTLFRAGTVSAKVLVEAKLHSPKGWRAGTGSDADAGRPDPDQLVRYWQELERRAARGVPARLVYLTAHGSPPLDELAASLRRHVAAPGGRPMQLGWLSWRDIWAAMDQPAAKRRPARDLRRLLEHKGLTVFGGFNSSPWRPYTGRATFWSAPWFGAAPWQHPRPVNFWEGRGHG